MARKDDFDLDLDMDFGSDFDMKPVKRNGAIEEIKYQLKRKKNEMFSNPLSYLKKVAKYSMPNEITRLYEKASEDYDVNVQKLMERKERASETGRDLLNIRKSFQNTAIRSKLDKLYNKFYSEDENSAYQYTAKTEDQANQDTLQATIDEIFNTSKSSTQATIENQRDIASLSETLQTKRHQENIVFSSSMSRSLELSNQFSFNVTERYYRKSLEIQLKSYFALSSIAKTSSNLFEVQKTQLDAIIKNTSLPDISKMSLAKQAKKSLYETAVGSAGNKLLGSKTMVGRLMKPLTEQSSTGSMVGMAASMLGMMGEDMSIEDMIVDAVEEFGIDYLSRPIKEYLTTKLKNSKNPKIRQIVDAVKNPDKFKEATSPGINKARNWVNGKESKFREKGGAGNTFLASIMDKISMVIDKLDDYVSATTMENKAHIALFSGKRLSAEDLHEGVHFDVATRKSIVEVMPRYLSLIHQELKAIRTGKLTDELGYDYRNSKFSSVKDINKGAMIALKKSANSGMSSMLSEDIIGGSNNGEYNFNGVNYYQFIDNAFKMTLAETNGEYKGKSLSSKAKSYLKEKLPPDVYSIVVRNLERKDKDIAKDYRRKDKLSGIMEDKEQINHYTASKISQTLEDILKSNPYAKELLIKKGLMSDESTQLDLDKFLETLHNDKDEDDHIEMDSSGKFKPNSGKRRHKPRVSSNGGTAVLPRSALKVVGMSDVVTNTQNIYELLKEGVSIAGISKAGKESISSVGLHGNTVHFDTESINLLADAIGNRVSQSFHENSKGFRTWFDDKKNKIKNATATGYKHAKRGYGKVKDFLSDVDFRGMYENTKGYVGSKINSAKNFIGKGIKHALGIYHGIEDVYVRGETEPRMLKILISRGDYYFDQLNKTPINNVGDIKGPVVDHEGNVILTMEDLKTGIVDKDGNVFSNLAVKGKDLIKGLLVKGIEKGLPVLTNLLKYAKDKGIDVFNYMKSKVPGMFSFFKNVLEVPFSFFGSFRTGNVISSKVHNRLVEIRDLLNSRMKGKKHSYSEGEIEVDEKGEIKSSIGGTIGKVNDAINKAGKILGKEGKTSEEGAGLAERAGDTISNAKNTIKDIKDTITDKDKRDEHGQRVKDKLKDTYDALTGKKKLEEENVVEEETTKGRKNKNRKPKKKTAAEIRKEMKEEHREEIVKMDETAKNLSAYTKDPKQRKSIMSWLRNLRRKPVAMGLMRDYQTQRTANEVSEEHESHNTKDGDGQPKGKKSMLGRLVGLAGSILSGIGSMATGIFKLLFTTGTIVDIAKSIFYLLPGAKYLAKGAKYLGKGAKGLWDGAKWVGKKLKIGTGIKTAGKWIGSKVFTRMAASAAADAAISGGAAVAGTGAAAAAGAVEAGAVVAGGAAAATGAEAAAAGFLGLTPVGWTILGIAAVGTAAYFGYKYITRDNVNDIDKLRYFQYGLGDKYKNKYHLIKALEDIVTKAKVVEGGVVDYYKLKAHAKEISEIFEIDMRDKQHITRFNSWIVKRFFPVMIKHNAAYASVNKDINVTNTDKIEKNKLGEVLLNVKVGYGILNERYSPFKGDDLLITYPKEVIDLYNKMLLANKIDKSKLQSDVKTDIVAKAAEFHAFKHEDISTNDKANVMATVNDKIKVADRNSKMITSTVHSLNMYRKLDASDYGRGMAYGLNDYDKIRMVNINNLEYIMSDYVVVKNSNVSVNIPEEVIYRRVGPFFGITEKHADSSNPWFIWFKERFLPIFSTYVGIIYNLTGKYKPNTFTTGISNEVKFQYLTALKGMAEAWRVTSSPWLNYKLNTNSESLDDVIKYYTPADPTDNNIKSEVASKLNANKTPIPSKVKQAVSLGKSPASEKPMYNPSKYYGAETLPITTGVSSNLADSRSVGNAALADKYIKAGSNVDFSGVNPAVLKLFRSMVAEYGKKTGKKVQVNSAFRSAALQAKLRSMYGSRAAAPGHSMHGLGLAIDINSSDADAMAKLGLFEKYGFSRPVSNETWHIEPTAFNGIRNQVKADPSIATDLIYKSLASNVYNEVFAKGTTTVNNKSLAFKGAGTSPESTSPKAITSMAFKNAVNKGNNPVSGSTGAGSNTGKFGPDVPPASQLVGSKVNYGSIDTSDMVKLINQVSAMTGTNAELNLAIAAEESSMNPSAVSSTGATGLFQFTAGTWGDMVKKYGKMYGITENTPRTDPKANATLGALYVKEHSASMGGTTDPVFIEAANMAPAYAPKFYELYHSAPETSASDVFSQTTIKHNRGMFAPNGRVLTLGELYSNIQARIARSSKSAGLGNPKTAKALKKESRTISLKDIPGGVSKTAIPIKSSPAEVETYASNTNLPTTKAPAKVSLVPDPMIKYSTQRTKPIEQPKNLINELSPRVELMIKILDKSLETQVKMLERLVSIDGNISHTSTAASTQAPAPKNKSEPVKMPTSNVDIKRSVT